ncbi:hypothetical protein FD27_GL000183 [Limosilactobacillus frumenti DSM 13145]|uniref:SHOCT-like domain-containing protein n=2 Tax=Limosilactobacillus frumenti TaxID=104955 RepID=A0A0R1PED0_9LACO|nr:hypothetical protein FD27_GL000183 [Limosilactobacillus frumenti DSM 13145]
MVYFLNSPGLSVEVITMTKQVKTVTCQPLMPVKTGMTQQQLLDEIHYQQSRQIITKLLNKGLLSENEFKQIDQLNQQSFPPLIKPESVDTSATQS